jgi:Winged helix DNA-binding domain
MGPPSPAAYVSGVRLSWERALAWRLQRHRLVERAAPRDLLGVVSQICGLHAQLMSSAELTLWARIDGLASNAVNNALWRNRTLVKLWAMRGTLHLLASAELGLWIGALNTYTNRGMTGHREIDVLTDAIGRALKRRPLSREELALAVVRITGDSKFGDYVRSSWGSYLKPASFRGQLCFADDDQGRVRFTKPEAWLSRSVEQWEREDALLEVARRFLSAYAPLTREDLGLWSGFGRARAAKMLSALGDEAVEVTVGRDRSWVLARDLPELTVSEPVDVARLLPAFDPWVVGASRTSEAVLDPRHKTRVFRPQGWFSPVLLVNGRMVGVWKHARKGQRLLVELEPFARLPAWARAQLESEAERLAEFLGCEMLEVARRSA